LRDGPVEAACSNLFEVFHHFHGVSIFAG